MVNGFPSARMRESRQGAELDTWPHAPGESPFQAKGINFSGHMRWTSAHFPGGIPRMLELLDPANREFFDQRFLASSRYDLHPLCVAGRAMAADLGLSYLGFVRKRCRWQAEQDLGGVYRVLLSVISSEWAARTFPRQLQQTFNFGTATCNIEDKGHVTAIVEGLPAALFPWWAAVVEEYATVLLERGGAHAPHVVVRQAGTPLASGDTLVTANCDFFFHVK